MRRLFWAIETRNEFQNEFDDLCDNAEPILSDVVRAFEEVAEWVTDLFEECEDCGGHGHEPGGGCCDGDIDPCRGCDGRGWVPGEKLGEIVVVPLVGVGPCVRLSDLLGSLAEAVEGRYERPPEFR